MRSPRLLSLAALLLSTSGIAACGDTPATDTGAEPGQGSGPASVDAGRDATSTTIGAGPDAATTAKDATAPEEDATTTTPDAATGAVDAATNADATTTTPDASTPGPVVPADPPAGSTPASLGYAVRGAKHYYVIGNALVAGDSALSLTVTTPAASRRVDLFLDGVFAGTAASGAGAIALSGDLGALAPGKHVALLSERGQPKAFARIDFLRGHPYYVFVSNDWDVSDNDPSNAVWKLEEGLHTRHAELKITHFVGPYTFTDPAVTPARRSEIVKWVLGMKTAHDDEIGLHIHPYCNFVTAAGVTCRTRPSFQYPSGSTQTDTTGYTVVLAEYDHAEMLTLLKSADTLFAKNGLGKPTSFRAGGWTAEAHTLQALADDKFVIDASGANWSRLTDWSGDLLYDWNQSHWAPIDDMSQPWYPSVGNMLSSAAPRLPILEVPDNGILVDYITGPEMVKVFDENWAGDALTTPKVLSIGYHPVSLARNPSWASRLHTVMDHADQFLATTGNGPVFYVRGSDLPKGMPLKP